MDAIKEVEQKMIAAERRRKKKFLILKMRRKEKKLKEKMAQGEISKKKIPNNKRSAKQMNKKQFKSMPPFEQMNLNKAFKQAKMSMYKRFTRLKKKLYELQSEKQEDFVDYEGMVRLQKEIYHHNVEELKRRKAIYVAEIAMEKAMRLNLPLDILLIQDDHLRKLRHANQMMNEAFQRVVDKERGRIVERTQLSRARRLELEEKAWQKVARDAALQRAETAELMVLLEEICGHPAEETVVQPKDDCGLEDISSEDEFDMENEDA